MRHCPQFHSLTLLAVVMAGMLSLATASLAEEEAPFGKQVSEAGIKHSFLITGVMTAIIGEDNQILWKARAARGMGSSCPAATCSFHKVIRPRSIRVTGRSCSTYTLAAPNKELGTAVRLADGNTLIVERGPKPRLLEVDREGKVQASVPLQPDSDNAHMQTRMARKLPSGNYLVPHLLGFAVKEYRPDGTVA